MTVYHLLLRVAVLATATAAAVASAAPTPASRPAPSARPALPAAPAPTLALPAPPSAAPALPLLPAAAPALPTGLPAEIDPTAAPPAATGPWRALVVGGGPRAPMNQVAIEGNVRYFHGLLPAAVERRVLFADGSTNTPSVQYLDGNRMRYRAPRLPRIDGSTTSPGLDAAWRGFVAARPRNPLLLYFTGHGSPNPRGNLDNNVFDLWGGGGLSVRELAARVEALPEGTPVVLVMAQCFSGAFANLLFEGGRPDGAPVERDFVGFFAATKERPASGCTPEINEADYDDFSSFFFSALSGVDRLGRRVSGADFDQNRFVGMNEAFAYALIHQATSDVPVATSDVFLRRFVTRPDHETMATPYAKVLSWASPAERAALEALSGALLLRGEDRMRVAYDLEFGPGRMMPDVDDITSAHRLRFIRLAKSVVLANALRQSGNQALIERFERLRAAEARNPLAEAKARS